MCYVGHQVCPHVSFRAQHHDYNLLHITVTLNTIKITELRRPIMFTCTHAPGGVSKKLTRPSSQITSNLSRGAAPGHNVAIRSSPLFCIYLHESHHIFARSSLHSAVINIRNTNCYPAAHFIFQKQLNPVLRLLIASFIECVVSRCLCLSGGVLVSGRDFGEIDPTCSKVPHAAILTCHWPYSFPTVATGTRDHHNVLVSRPVCCVLVAMVLVTPGNVLVKWPAYRVCSATLCRAALLRSQT